MPTLLPKKCLYPTADGTPCENLVSSGIDHCAAGHPVQTHKINVSYLGSCNDPSLPQEGTLDAEDIIGIALDAPETTKERRQRYLDTLVAKSGVDPSSIEPLNTIYSARRRLSDGDVVPLELDIYKFQGPKSTVYLAYGDLGNEKRWYLRSPCTKPQCGDAGFIQLHQTEKWSPKRSLMFRKSIEEATTKANKVECPMHRTPLGS